MRVVLAIVAFVLLLVALIALAPATLLDERIAALTGQRMRLAGAAGTVWNGSGAIVDAHGQWRVPIAWRVDPLAALSGEVVVSMLRTPGSAGSGTVAFGADGTRVDALDLHVPAAALQSAFVQPPVPRFGGTLAISAPGLRLARIPPDAPSGSFDVQWDRARVALGSMSIDAGTVDAHGQGAGDTLVMTLRNRGGDVAVAGEVRLRGATATLDGVLTPSATLAPTVALMIASLGPRMPGGGVHVTWQGRW